MYRVARQLPEIEKFGLAGQIRRAAVSVTNNIAEGHGRYHYLDQIKFMLISRGSIQELIDDINVCEDENYIAISEVARLKNEGWRAGQLLNGYIRFLREQKTGSSATLHESAPAYGINDDDLDVILKDWPPTNAC